MILYIIILRFSLLKNSSLSHVFNIFLRLFTSFVSVCIITGLSFLTVLDFYFLFCFFFYFILVLSFCRRYIIAFHSLSYYFGFFFNERMRHINVGIYVACVWWRHVWAWATLFFYFLDDFFFYIVSNETFLSVQFSNNFFSFVLCCSISY